MIRKLLGLAILLLISSSPAWAVSQCSNTSWNSSPSIVCIAEAHNFNNTSASTITTGNFGTSPIAGNYIWVGQSTEFNQTAGSNCNTTVPTDTQGNTFTFIIGRQAPTTSGGGPACIWYAKVTNSGTDAVTCKWSVAQAQQDCDALLISGFASSSALDGSCYGDVSPGTNPTCGTSIAPAVDGETFLVYCAYANGTLGAGTSFTFVDSTVDNSEYFFQATAGTITPAYTNATSANYLVLAASFKPQATSTRVRHRVTQQ